MSATPTWMCAESGQLFRLPRYIILRSLSHLEVPDVIAVAEAARDFRRILDSDELVILYEHWISRYRDRAREWAAYRAERTISHTTLGAIKRFAQERRAKIADIELLLEQQQAETHRLMDQDDIANVAIYWWNARWSLVVGMASLTISLTLLLLGFAALAIIPAASIPVIPAVSALGAMISLREIWGHIPLEVRISPIILLLQAVLLSLRLGGLSQAAWSLVSLPWTGWLLFFCARSIGKCWVVEGSGWCGNAYQIRPSAYLLTASVAFIPSIAAWTLDIGTCWRAHRWSVLGVPFVACMFVVCIGGGRLRATGCYCIWTGLIMVGLPTLLTLLLAASYATNSHDVVHQYSLASTSWLMALGFATTSVKNMRIWAHPSHKYSALARALKAIRAEKMANLDATGPRRLQQFGHQIGSSLM